MFHRELRHKRTNKHIYARISLRNGITYLDNGEAINSEDVHKDYIVVDRTKYDSQEHRKYKLVYNKITGNYEKRCIARWLYKQGNRR